MTDPMDENGFENEDEMSFEELFESYDAKMTNDLNQGDKVDGKIISIGDKSVYIDTGTKSDGVVNKIELLDEEGELPYKEGDIITLYVVSLSESEIVLSKAISGAGQAAMLGDAARSRTPVEGKVVAVIKGGFHIDIVGKRAFCPVSQIDVKYVETPDDYIGQTHNFIITRFEESGRNIVVSRRDLLEEEIKEQQKAFFAKIKEGDVVQGTVTKLMSYGAFIELSQGVEGMVHISELSWSRVEKAEEILNSGDVVTVRILKIETQKGPDVRSDVRKISLSMKQTSDNPWDSVDTIFHSGDQVTGKVVRLTSFGAFVEIAPGIDGLVHISEMSHTKRVLKPDDVVQQGEQVQVVVKSIDLDAKRISLSIKEAAGDPWTGIIVRFPINSIVDGTLEKREKFGLFINLEPGVTGLMPSSHIRNATKPSDYDSLKPGDSVKIMVQEIDEENRRMTLTSPDQKDGDNWKQFAGAASEKSFGSMAGLFQEALDKDALDKDKS
ncbi:MAG: 30S ribosomal protein S1 [Desulfobacula sp.]|nr:30S ribosomal protein S1 [Desulfobacula sp.]